jgi:hypothetical protein
MSTVRVRMRRWGTRTRGSAVRVEVRPALVVVACVVALFGVFFAVGRVTRDSSGGSTSYGPQKLPAVSVPVGIPYGLAAAPPIPALVVAEAPAPPPPKSSSAAVAGSSSAPEASSSYTAPSTSKPVESVTPTPTPTQTQAPAPAPVRAAPAPVSRPHATAPSSEGGSFDSSG